MEIEIEKKLIHIMIDLDIDLDVDLMENIVIWNNLTGVYDIRDRDNRLILRYDRYAHDWIITFI